MYRYIIQLRRNPPRFAGAQKCGSKKKIQQKSEQPYALAS